MEMREKKAGLRITAAMALSLAAAGIWFLMIYQRIPFLYDINDDVAMRNVASGVITGEPDAHLLHIKYVLGLVISGLYRRLPGFDWYGLVLIGIVLLSFAAALYRGLAAEKGFLWKGAYLVIGLLLMTCLGLQHVSVFQWTTAAACAGASGIYLFYTAQDGPGYRLWLEEGLAVFLLLLCLLIRDDVFLMMMPVMALCFWWKYGLRRLQIPLGLLAGVALILIVEALAYRTPEWREFRSYNTDREAIMDYYGIQDYEEDPEFYDSLGITPEEAENLQRYSLYLLGNLYSENMKLLAEHEREVYLEEHSLGERVASGLSQIYEHLGKDTYRGTNLICLVMIGLTLGLCVGKNKRQLGLCAAFLALWGSYWFYLGFRNRLLERVGFALYLLAFLMMLAVWYRCTVLEKADGEKQGTGVWVKAGNVFSALGIGLTLVLMASGIWRTVRDYNAGRSDYNLQFLDVNRYMAEHSENVYFMTTFSIETYTDNFTIRRDFSFSNLLSVGGWHTFSPLENEKCERLGITDPKTDIVEKGNVYVISLANVNLRYMDRYYESLYGERYLGRELVDTLDYGEQSFEVYDFTVVGAEK